MKNIHISSLIFLILSLSSFSVSGKNERKILDRIISPDYINLQYAGNLGLGSIGSGYISKNDRHNYGFSYGYLPESVNGVEVHTFSAKGAFNFKKLHLSKKTALNGYFGTNLLYAVTDNTYMKFPGYYPSDYYFANAVHFAPFIGLKVGSMTGSRGSLSKHTYIELGTVDYYLFQNVKDRRLKFRDCMNICMGIALPINERKNSKDSKWD